MNFLVVPPFVIQYFSLKMLLLFSRLVRYLPRQDDISAASRQ
jgi:hypothetical protein